MAWPSRPGAHAGRIDPRNAVKRIVLSLVATLVVVIALPAYATEAELIGSPRLSAWLAENAPWTLDVVLGRAVWRLLAMVLTIGAVLLLRRPAISLAVRGAKTITGATETELDDQVIEALEAPVRRFVLAVGLYLGVLWVELSGGPQGVIDTAFRISVIIIVGWAGLRSISIVIRVLTALSERTENRLDDHLVPLVGRILRIAIVCLIAMITFQELGINVAGLIAGLGVGGLALALAAKDTVANWFGALMVYTDRPFEMGDTITVAGITGTVEDLGLRSTRIRTSDKTLVTLPNSTLTGAHIENLSWRTKRKGTNNVALAVGTRPDKVRAVIGAIQAILERTEGVEQGTHDVKLAEVTSTELTLMVQYFTESAAWDEFLRVREAVHLSVLEELEALGVALAVPTTALKVDGSPPALG